MFCKTEGTSVCLPISISLQPSGLYTKFFKAISPPTKWEHSIPISIARSSGDILQMGCQFECRLRMQRLSSSSVIGAHATATMLTLTFRPIRDWMQWHIAHTAISAPCWIIWKAWRKQRTTSLAAPRFTSTSPACQGSYLTSFPDDSCQLSLLRDTFGAVHQRAHHFCMSGLFYVQFSLKWLPRQPMLNKQEVRYMSTLPRAEVFDGIMQISLARQYLKG